MFKSKLYNILNDLKQHQRDRSTIMEESVQERLNKALNEYNKSIADSYNYLTYRSSLRVMKKLNRRVK